jgi:hypothetical protein
MVSSSSGKVCPFFKAFQLAPDETSGWKVSYSKWRFKLNKKIFFAQLSDFSKKTQKNFPEVYDFLPYHIYERE